MGVPMTSDENTNSASVPSVPGLPPLRWLDRSGTASYEDGLLIMTAGERMDWFNKPISGSRTATAPVLVFLQDSGVQLTSRTNWTPAYFSFTGARNFMRSCASKGRLREKQWWYQWFQEGSRTTRMDLSSLKVPSGCVCRHSEMRTLSIIHMTVPRGTCFGCFDFLRRETTNRLPPASASVRKRPWRRPVRRRSKICDTERTAW